MDKIYTDAKKIQRLSALHKSEKKEIAELKARITALKTAGREYMEASQETDDEFTEAFYVDKNYNVTSPIHVWFLTRRQIAERKFSALLDTMKG